MLAEFIGNAVVAVKKVIGRTERKNLALETLRPELTKIAKDRIKINKDADLDEDVDKMIDA